MDCDYDLLVIGGGSAGLTAGGIASSLGVKTLLIEKDRLGGDCTWTGCIPSKTLLAEAKKVHTASQLTNQDPKDITDFSRIRQRIQSVQQQIYEEADSPEALKRFGVEVVEGAAKFVDKQTLEVTTDNTTQKITGSHIFIATGASPVVPPIDGLEGVEYLTSDTLFAMESQPDELAIIGGGPIGVEMAQAFNRLGTAVTIIESQDSILPSNTDLTSKLQEVIENEGVRVQTGVKAQQVSDIDKGIKVTTDDGQEVIADKLLLAAGRFAHTESLNLPQAGVQTDKDGSIKTNSYGRTNQRNIYAIGDVAGPPQFTHQSEFEAKRAVFRALFKLPLSADKVTPRVTYTDPELAAVGKSRQHLEDNSVEYDTYTFPHSKLDRANTDKSVEGGITVFAKSGGSEILGAQILGPRAGELSGEFGLAIQNNVSLRDIAQTVHPYPSYGLGVRRLADQFIVQNQPTWLISLAKFIFGYRGKVFQPSEDEMV